MITSLVLASLIAVTNCAPRQVIMDFLRKEFGEAIISSALTVGGALIEEVVNKETGTWSTLVTIPRRYTCIVASGTDWHVVLPEEILGGEDA